MIKLKHAFVNLCRNKENLFTWKDENKPSLREFMKNIEKEAASRYPDPDDIKHLDKFKGDVFECFVEFLLKRNPIWINNYEPNPAEEDLGVDGFGIGTNGKLATVQIKYRSNPTYELTANQDGISNFPSHSVFKFGVDPNDTQNLLVVTTAKGIHYKTLEMYAHKVVCLNYNDLNKLTNNKLFWDEFKKAFCVTLTKNPSKLGKLQPLYEHQQEALDATLNNTKGIIHLPTGTGKTTIIARSIIEKIKNNTTIEPIIIASPRIILTKQILTDIQKDLIRSRTDVMYQIVNSSNDKENEEITGYINALGYTPNSSRPTTIPAEIKNIYNKSKKNKVPLVICAVYDSVKRIKEAKIPVSNLYCDEAHHLLENDFNYITDSNTFPGACKYYFTATLKETGSDNGLGMNNKDKYGEVIYHKSPMEMVNKGIIVRPRLHVISTVNNFITVGDTVNKQESIDPHAIVTAFNEHKAELNKYSDIGAKLLVICKGTIHLEGILNSKYFIDYCKKHKSLKVFSISSNGGACIGVGEQKKEVSREDWLNQVKSLKDNNDAIIFHIDILTEGIDVPGITGILPLTTMTKSKMYQNFGRASRLTVEDRKKLLAGELSTDFLNNREAVLGYRKPYAYVIVPNYTEANLEVAEQWKEWLGLFREYGSDPKEDIIISGKMKTNTPVPLTLLNQEDEKNKGIVTTITKLYHEIEEEEKANYFFLNVPECSTLEDINKVYEEIGIKSIADKYTRFNTDWFNGHKYLAKFLPDDQVITPKDLVENMLNKFTGDWKDPTLKILVPYFGAGEFLISIYTKLKEAGHSDKHIIENMLYGIDPNPENIKFMEEFWKFNQYKHNLKVGSILNKDLKDMKTYDLIIMNPPFKEPKVPGKKRSGKNLDVRIWDKCFSLKPKQMYSIMSDTSSRSNNHGYTFRETIEMFEGVNIATAIVGYIPGLPPLIQPKKDNLIAKSNWIKLNKVVKPKKCLKDFYKPCTRKNASGIETFGMGYKGVIPNNCIGIHERSSCFRFAIPGEILMDKTGKKECETTYLFDFTGYDLSKIIGLLNTINNKYQEYTSISKDYNTCRGFWECIEIPDSYKI